MKERANATFSSLQRNSYAMSILRSKLESRINFIKDSGGQIDSCQELTRMLDLVKNGELILKEMSEKVESARFLEEFIQIIDSAAASFGEIKGDIEQLAPMAEAALNEMHETLASVSTMAPGLRQDIDPLILSEATASIPAPTNQPCSANAVAKDEDITERQPRIMRQEKEMEAEGVAI